MNARIANGGWTEVKSMETLSNLVFEPQGPRHIPVPHDYAITFFKDQLSNHGIEIVAEKIADLIKKSVPDYLLGEWRLANNLASMPIFDAVVECLIEKGVLTPPENGIGAEGCWMSVEK